MANVIRVAKSDEYRTKEGLELPFSKAFLYRMSHQKRYPRLFSKVGHTLLLDLSELDNLIEEGRILKTFH